MLIPLAMAARSFTIDIGQVYDECVEDFGMRMNVWIGVLAIGTAAGATAFHGQGQSPGQKQGQPMVSAASASMAGAVASDGQAMTMETGKPAVPAGPLKITFGDKTSEW